MGHAQDRACPRCTKRLLQEESMTWGNGRAVPRTSYATGMIMKGQFSSPAGIFAGWMHCDASAATIITPSPVLTLMAFPSYFVMGFQAGESKAGSA